MQRLLPTSASDVIFVNVFLASLILGMAVSLSGPLFRRKSLILQHRMLSLSLILTVACPLSSGLATAFGWGLFSLPFSQSDRESTRPLNRSESEIPDVWKDGVNDFFHHQSAESRLADSSPVQTRSRPAAIHFRGSGLNLVSVWLPARISTWIGLIWGTGFVLVLYRVAAGLRSVVILSQTLRKATNPRLLRAAKRTLTGPLEGTRVYQSRLALTPLTIGW